MRPAKCFRGSEARGFLKISLLENRDRPQPAGLCAAGHENNLGWSPPWVPAVIPADSTRVGVSDRRFCRRRFTVADMIELHQLPITYKFSRNI